MLSARTGWDLTPNRLSSVLEARRRRGEPVLDLTETNPTRVGIPYPPDLLAPLADPAALTYEPSPRGLASAREAVSADHARRGVTVDPGRVLLTASTSEAYAWLFKLLCDPGDALLALCADRELALISDEVFADYTFGSDPRRAASLASDGAALAFSLGGLSKSCGLPQLKLAWIAVSGPEKWRAPALARLEVVADTYLSVSTPVQRAAPALLARRRELQRPIAERVAANRDALRRRLGAGSPASLLGAEGGWSAILQVPAAESEEQRVTRLLEEQGVLVHPGYFFDFPREAFLVLSLLPPRDVFEEAIDRILAVL